MKKFKKINEVSFKKLKSLREAGIGWADLSSFSFSVKNSYSRKAIDVSATFGDYSAAIKDYIQQRKHRLTTVIKPILKEEDFPAKAYFESIDGKLGKILNLLIALQNEDTDNKGFRPFKDLLGKR
jgi:hypothetical protein